MTTEAKRRIVLLAIILFWGLVTALLTLAVMAAPAAGQVECELWPPDPSIPAEQKSCIVRWGPDTKIVTSPLNLVLDMDRLRMSVCYLQEPAATCPACIWCPETSGATWITYKAWCNRLRVLSLPAGGTEAMRAVLVDDLCVRVGA